MLRSIWEKSADYFNGGNDDFSQRLGYKNFSELMENTFSIFEIPEDAYWLATILKNGEWAVWTDVGYAPHDYVIFKTWEEAIRYSREKFELHQYPEECWCPEGFDIGEDVFAKLPEKEKRFY